MAAGVDLSFTLPWIPLITALVLLWSVSSNPMIQYTLMPILKIYGVTAIVSAVVVLLVADRLSREHISEGESDSNVRNMLGGMPPATWFVAVLAAWPVAFPLFLWVHYRNSAPVRMVSGVLAALFFLGILLYGIFGIRSGEPEWAAAPEPGKVLPDRTPVPVDQAGVVEPGFAPPLPSAPGSTPAPTPPPIAAPRIPAELSVVPSAKRAGPGQPAAPVAPPTRSSNSGSDGGSGGSTGPGVGVSILKPKGGGNE